MFHIIKDPNSGQIKKIKALYTTNWMILFLEAMSEIPTKISLFFGRFEHTQKKTF